MACLVARLVTPLSKASASRLQGVQQNVTCQVVQSASAERPDI